MEGLIFGILRYDAKIYDFLQCCGQKRPSFPPILLKFNFVWGVRGGPACFTNITGKAPTLLTSIVVPRPYYSARPMRLGSRAPSSSDTPLK